MDYFALMPVKVLEEEIWSRVKPKDLISLSQTCRLLNNAVPNNDKLWTEVCYNEYKIKISSCKGFARKFYKHILHPYGQHIGLWTKETDNSTMDCYGSLLQILFVDGKLQGVEHQPPKVPHLMEPLRPKTIFTISLDEANDGKAIIKCCINPQKQHDCTLLYDIQTINEGKPSLYLMRRCASSAIDGNEHQHLASIFQEKERYRADQIDMTDQLAIRSNQAHFDEKYSVLDRTDYVSNYSKLKFPMAPKHNSPIRPGIFKGTTRDGGIQLVMLSYVEDTLNVNVTKITGDKDIPAGQLSIQADLSGCMALDRGIQSSIQRLRTMRNISINSDYVDWTEFPKQQPFIKPIGCYLQYPVVPNVCITRAEGFRMVFHTNTKNLEKHGGHWIVFNQDLFGFLWFMYNHLSLYHRVQDPLFQTVIPRPLEIKRNVRRLSEEFYWDV